MRKMHQITHFAFDEKAHNHLLKTKDLVCVSTLPCGKDVQLLAYRHGGDRVLKLKDFSTGEKPYTNLYIKAFGDFYQVAAVFDSVDQANSFMLEREDAALIDSTTLKDVVTEQFHFIASLRKAN